MKYLSDYMQEKQTKLLNETGAFFAFSKTQFNEQKKEGIPYISLDGGLFCPKQNVQSIIDGLEKIYKDAIKQDFEENGPENIISREYFNHECQITLNIQPMIEAISGHIEMFPNSFTDELIKEVAKKCFNEAVENDWF